MVQTRREPKGYAHHLAFYLIDEHLRSELFLRACANSADGDKIKSELEKLRDWHNEKAGMYRQAV